tara:strand:- start:109570 stop:110376 length:807 start_codon:yes stop_codon:yes gene_type:complete
MVEAALSGHSIAKIARDFGVTERAVRKACNDKGVSMYDAKAARERRVADCVQKGMTRAEIESQYGANLSFIRTACEKYGVAFEPLGLNTDKSLKILSLLCNTNRSLADIASTEGVSEKTVSDLHIKAIRHGLPIKQREFRRREETLKMKVGLSFENTIEAFPDLFRLITGRIRDVAELHILTSGQWNDVATVEARLGSLQIGYDCIASIDADPGYINEQGIKVVISDEDALFCSLPQEVIVLKLREFGNFDFEDSKWVYLKDHGIPID